MHFRRKPSLARREVFFLHTLTFDNFDEYAATIQDVDVNITLLNVVRRHWSIQFADVAGIHVQKGSQGSGDICVGRAPADGYTFALPGMQAPLHRVNGVTLQARSAVILEPGCEFCLSTSTAHEWYAVFVPTAMLGTQTRPSTRDCRVVQSSTGQVGQYLAMAERILIATQACPDVVFSGAIDDAMHDLLQMSSQLLGHPPGPAPVPVGRPRIPRTEIVHRIRQCLQSHEQMPLSPRELMQWVGVSERTLRDVFQQYFHVSPGRYLRLRQLQQIHHALRAAEPGSVLVSQILTRYGVWEFGRFARRYREAFGELPSQTLNGY